MPASGQTNTICPSAAFNTLGKDLQRANGRQNFAGADTRTDGQSHVSLSRVAEDIRAALFEHNHFVRVQAWQGERLIPSLTRHGQVFARTGRDRPTEHARQLDPDVPQLDRGEVCRVRMPGPVHQMDQRPLARRLIHDGHLDQWMRIRLQLAAAWQEVVDNVGHQAGMSLRAVPVIEPTNVPWNVGKPSFTVLGEHESGDRRLDLVTPDLLRRTEHRRGYQ